jgi:very-short-patch-repair endonuclease
VMRFWNIDVMEGLDAVCEQIAWAVRRRRFEADASADPLPSSPFQGEG